MKISWGTGIVLAIITFMGFILYLVVTMTTGSEFNHDLVTEEYYKQELTFQDQLNREANSQNLTENIQIQKTEEGILISFPGNLDFSQIKGNILVYRPSNKRQDFDIPLELSASQMIIAGKHLEKGRWNLEIDWSYGEESYYYKKEFTY